MLRLNPARSNSEFFSLGLWVLPRRRSAIDFVYKERLFVRLVTPETIKCRWPTSIDTNVKSSARPQTSYAPTEISKQKTVNSFTPTGFKANKYWFTLVPRNPFCPILYMTTVFTSGCYDILHAGHIQFFKEAKALGDHLTVCFASDEVLWEHKKRRTSIPQDHKLALMTALEVVDQVVIGSCEDLGLDFKEHFLKLRPDILVVTEDDQYEAIKRALCEEIGATYIALPKTPPQFTPISSSSIVRNIRTPAQAPLRVDFGGGWLDVPRHAREGGLIVNCAISPLVSLNEWSYEQKSGLGGSGAWALLNGNDGVESELSLGVGWQDPAVIRETGACVWRSGDRPVLEFKRNGDFLKGHMALLYTDIPHDTPANADNQRDYDMIEQAGQVAADAVLEGSIPKLGEAIEITYQMQLKEGMTALPEAEGCVGRKYSGGGVANSVANDNDFCNRLKTPVSASTTPNPSPT